MQGYLNVRYGLKHKEFRIRAYVNLVLTVILIFNCMVIGGCSGNQAGIEADLSEIAVAESVSEDAYEESSGESDAVRIYVYVCGAVKNPGVYELSSGSRVYEAIEKAGGLKKRADDTAVNQAEELVDGQQINIPYRNDAEGTNNSTGTSGGTDSASDKVNINTAGAEELKTLTGIGDSKASAIIQYRTEHGSFSSIEELMQIDGIKEGVYNNIKDQITI